MRPLMWASSATMPTVLGYEFHPTVVDTVALARVLLPNLNRYKLDTVAKALNVSLENHHRAVDDAEATAGIFLKFVEMLKKQHGMETLDDLNVFNHGGGFGYHENAHLPCDHPGKKRPGPGEPVPAGVLVPSAVSFPDGPGSPRAF